MTEARAELHARIAQMRDEAEGIAMSVTRRHTKERVLDVIFELDVIRQVFLDGQPLTRVPEAEARLLVAAQLLVAIAVKKLEHVAHVVRQQGLGADADESGLVLGLSEATVFPTRLLTLARVGQSIGECLACRPSGPVEDLPSNRSAPA